MIFSVQLFCILIKRPEEQWKKTVIGKSRLGVEIFAKALLCIPMGLVENSGMDKQDKLLMLLAEHERTGEAVGIDILSGETMVK